MAKRYTHIPALMDRVNMLKNDRDETVRSIAKGSGVSKSTIYNITIGKGADANTVIKLAEYFGVTSDWLLGITDDMGVES